MSSDTEKIIFAGQKLANALAGLFGSEEDSLVADSPPSFGYESPYYKGILHTRAQVFGQRTLFTDGTTIQTSSVISMT